MPNIIDSLFVRLGFITDPKELEGFAKAGEKAKSMAIGLGAAIGGAMVGIEEMVKGTAEKMGGIQNFAEQMGLSARSVAVLGKVARDNDSSLEAMEGSLRSMTVMAGQAAQGVGRGAMMFRAYGLHAKNANGQTKTTEELLGDVADRLQKMPSLAQRNALGTRLGFDPATIKLLAQGRGHLQALRAEAAKEIPFSDRQYEDAEKAEKQFRKVGGAIVLLKDRISVALMPQVNLLLERFTKWTKNRDNIDKITFAIRKVVDVAKYLIDNSGKILAVFALIYASKGAAWFTELAEGMKKAAAKGGLLKASLDGLRGLLKGALLTAIGLVIEDLIAFSRGGDSVTGWMVERFPYGVQVMEGALTVLSAAFLALTFSSGPIGLLALGIGGIIIAALALKDAWNPVVQWFEEAWDAMADKVAKLVNTLTGPLRWAWEKLGIDTSSLVMDEDHAGTRKREFNADHRPVRDRGPQGPLERAYYRTAATTAGGMLPGMGMFGPMLGAAAAGRAPAPSISTVTTGDIHLHVDGSKLSADDSEKLFQDFAKKLQDRGISGGQDAARVKARNSQTGHV